MAMNEEDVKRLEEALVRSHSALAKTYSNQQGEIIEKIRNLEEKLSYHIEQHNKDNDEIKKLFDDTSDKYILKDVKPVIAAYNNAVNAGEAVKWFAGVFTAIGVLWMVFIKGIYKP
jgi:hypothetical protein